MLALERGTPPEMRKARTVQVQASAFHISNISADDDSTATIRTQFLSRRGVPFGRCGLIAALLFGEVS